MATNDRSLIYSNGYRLSSRYHLEGTMNLILSAPHGGNLTPDGIPDRSSGICFRRENSPEQRCQTTVIQDTSTDEFTENVANELYRILGVKPFVIIAQWSRKQIDFNREILEGTLNYPEAITAYHDYHLKLNSAVQDIRRTFGKGLLIDIHGHAKGNYTMIGYMMTKRQLNRDDLSDVSFRTSIESLCRSDRNEIIRGSSSFGTILEEHELGITYPSLKHPRPGSKFFFPGGYITKTYSTLINTIQTELPYEIRGGTKKLTHAKNYARAILKFMQIHDLLRTSSSFSSIQR